MGLQWLQNTLDSYDPLPELIRPYLSWIIVGTVCLIGTTALHMVIPQILRFAVDRLENGTATGAYLLYCGGGIVGTASLAGVLKFFTRQTVIVSSRDVEYDLRNYMFSHLLSLPAQFFDRAETGDVMNRLTNDLEAVRRMIGPATMYLTGNLSRTVLAITGMMIISPVLTIVAVIPFFLLALMMGKMNRIFHWYAKRVQEERSDLTSFAQQNIRGIRLIKAFRREQHQEEQFDRKSDEYRSENLNRARFLGFMRGVSGVSAEVGIAITLLMGGIWYIQGDFSYGDILGFTAYQFLLASPLLRLPRILNMIQRGRSSLERLQEILKYDSEPDPPTHPAVSPSRGGTLAVEDLTFSYPNTEQPVLKNISLEIPEGETLGIAGRTGAGKTTLLRLFPRLYPVPDETIFLSDVDVNRIPTETLRNYISFVPQHNFLFSTEIRENIAFPEDEWKMKEVKTAAKRTHIDQDIREFPEGYRQEIGERGVKLSGGQKQRAAKSRSLLPEAPILLMDDPFSNLDNATARGILNNLIPELEDRTWILVSHDVQLLTRCDRVIVLSEGRIQQKGDPEQLKDRDGLFHDLYREHKHS